MTTYVVNIYFALFDAKRSVEEPKGRTFCFPRGQPRCCGRMETSRQTHLLLPCGTRIVTRASTRCLRGAGDKTAGAVGVVIQAPEDQTHAYVVRFADGSEAALRRHELSILKQHYGEEVGAPPAVTCSRLGRRV